MGMRAITLVALLPLMVRVNAVPFSSRENININCGYQACHPIKEDHINVHLIPHSHDDLGWVKTVDQYYYGVLVERYTGAVQYIYQTVLDSLLRHKDRKFIHVETGFFWKWWQQQNDRTKDDFTRLVMNGQIEFTGGGWAMNDEAVTHYQSTIDQMTWGLRRLNETFGECARPRAGWQIDPFGHSNEMASIFAQMGYDGVILGRIDYQDHQKRVKDNMTDMVWRGSSNLGSKTDIFTSVLYNHYSAPALFCYEASCSSPTIVDDPESPEYNVESLARQLILQHVRYAMKPYSSNNVIVPMGDDFAYKNAEMWFMNMDKLIKHINSKREFGGQKYNIMYSTPACYVYAVHQETGGSIDSVLKTDDFLPYGSSANVHWTGFYTSRPQLKRFERKGNNFLQVAKQLYSVAGVSTDFQENLNSLREAMGVLQHHDAITGTEKQVVSHDYKLMLSKGIARTEIVTNEALSKLINPSHPVFGHCLQGNSSECALSEKPDRFIVTIYNPLSRYVNKYVRLPVLGKSYKITDPFGEEVKSQLMPIHSKILKIPGRASNATVELVFEALNVPPLGFKSYFIEKQEGDDVLVPDTGEQVCVHYDRIGFDADPEKGFRGNVTFANNVTIDLNQTFQYYCGAGSGVQSSGAYVFRRDPDIPLANVADTVQSNVIYIGPLFTEIHQVYSDMVGQTIRAYHDEDFLEFDWLVGPLPNYMINGREVITKYSTQLESESLFYTDSNGREMLERKRNFRPTWNLTIYEPEAQNYYPITSKITIKDQKRNVQLSILNDRAQGGSSLEDGQIEMMLHRNTDRDDALGVDERLFDSAYGTGIVVRGSHYMVAGAIYPGDDFEGTSVQAVEKSIAERKLLDSWVFISNPDESTFEDYQLSNKMEFSGLEAQLPPNVHILTLEPWDESTFLLRLEHMFESGEDPILSQPVSLSIEELFSTFQVTSMKETTLGANQWLEDSKRLVFTTTDQPEEEDLQANSTPADEFEITLAPMQIRTFIIKTEPKFMFM